MKCPSAAGTCLSSLVRGWLRQMPPEICLPRAVSLCQRQNPGKTAAYGHGEEEGWVPGISSRSQTLKYGVFIWKKRLISIGIPPNAACLLSRLPLGAVPASPPAVASSGSPVIKH